MGLQYCRGTYVPAGPTLRRSGTGAPVWSVHMHACTHERTSALARMRMHDHGGNACMCLYNAA